MSDSSVWSPSDYIKENIKKGASSFKWKHPSHYSRAVFATVTVLKTNRMTPAAISNADKMLTTYHNLFKFVGLYFMREAIAHKKIDTVLSKEGYLLRTTDDLFAVAFEKLMFDISPTSTQPQIMVLKRIVESIKVEAKWYAWIFLFLAHKDKIVEELDEEYFLLKELEAFSKPD